MEDVLTEPTPEEVAAAAYSACLDSVDVINRLNGSTDPEEMEEVARNREHLRIMLARDFWTNEDLTPIRAAIAGTSQTA